jgi:hypothetical protein
MYVFFTTPQVQFLVGIMSASSKLQVLCDTPRQAYLKGYEKNGPSEEILGPAF